ncbi:uncharacterized protein LOC111407514 isoform X2 [Olea europaea var. sylvestris]|uniref:BOD1/SHG1 domain-containing protein n=1 Tax=Olea europaea subsp. europaea TaxID=158383 RepID=A0A8S0VMY7_OLEEU|nr:uncharacterized protein LOC111407514 isoform X2 [Olea europaea var. sylvestris]CAA3032587.1 Hypothetical predicted protein [Olea europaea subsp. europaea]
MENNGDVREGNIKVEDVISKLKDDGDFDRLRVKIVRKLKENEELRNNIISMVKKSAALNHPGAENMKPRQLSDAIHKEIGEKVMSQISDGVWNIIRSGHGMKTEIVETVQSVYNKLSNPGGNDHWETSSHVDLQPVGFSLSDQDQSKKIDNVQKPNDKLGIPTIHKGKEIKEVKEGNSCSPAKSEPGNLESGPPPGFSSILEHKQSGYPNDEDPDVPPGFG